MDMVPTWVVRKIRATGPLIVGQVATQLPDWDYDDYDLVVSSIPSLVERFAQGGRASAYLPLAFEPSLVERIGAAQRLGHGRDAIGHPNQPQVTSAPWP